MRTLDRNRPMNKTELANDMRAFKAKLASDLETLRLLAPAEAPYLGSCPARWQIDEAEKKFGRVHWKSDLTDSRGYHIDFQLTLFKSEPVIADMIARVKRLPVQINPTTPRARRINGEDPDEANVALDIYGDAETAAMKLQAQLDRADELEIPEKQRRDLSGLIWNLQRRAKATSDPAKQRTAIVEKIIQETEERKAAERAAKRAVAASIAAEAHSAMPELKQLIAEHKARNLKLGIANETDIFECNYNGLPRQTPSPLHFNVSYSTAYTDRRTKNTKHNGKIKALQQEIAKSLGIWSHREKTVNLESYWRGEESSSTDLIDVWQSTQAAA